MSAETGLPSDLAILIAHRNDLEALKKLLQKIKNNPKLASLSLNVVDDHSQDVVFTQLSDYCAEQKLAVNLIRNIEEPGKKGALNHALKQIHSEYILQLDADVEPADDLYEQLSAAMRPELDLMVAGVRMEPRSSFWSQLAALDYLSLQLTTFSFLALAKPIMASGATMLYRRRSFLEHQEQGKDWQSGEDTFFIQSLAREQGSQIAFNPRAYSSTAAPQSLKALIRQRLRWGAKTVAYPSKLAKIIALLVAILNLYLFTAGMLLITGYVEFYPWLLLFLLKASGDYFLLYSYARLSGEKKLLRNYPIKALLYPLYISLVVLLIPFAPKKRWL